ALERPPEWPQRQRNVRACAAIGTAAVVSVAALWEAWGAARDGLGAQSRFFLILAALMILTALFGFGYWWPRRGAPAVRSVARGGRNFTEVRARASVFGLLVTMVTC